MSTALITGINGQDGSYLAEFLLGKGYHVVGLIRDYNRSDISRINHLYPDHIDLTYGDLTDQSSLVAALKEVKPDEVYNLAAQSFVPTSWSQPIQTSEVTALGVTRMLEAVRQVDPDGIRFYQASSSEMFGDAPPPQNEDTPFHPRSPYGVAKAYGHHMTVNYRESYDLYAVSGILFNHESPRRGKEFVSRKITAAVAAIERGQIAPLRMGNLDARRDWGFAGDYVEAMWLMLQQAVPQDFVVATGVAHTVQDMLEIAFRRVGRNWQDHVEIDPRYIRPAEVNHLLGDASRAHEALEWFPRTSFEQMVRDMVDADLAR